ncbi:TraB/VirB10 family protein [Noviherbaspirillum sp. ST9]|uniref:TraB/VirB10 family protein n=1 Tax=Noviherbaspirillum sp. ST9 TaxID=3401606 RepID=UPI003B58A1B9
MAAFDTSKLGGAVDRLTPKQRQYAALVAIMACGVGALWAVFAFTGGKNATHPPQSPASGSAAVPTNIGMMTPGQQVNPVDHWVGTAGRKLAQYEHEREEQTRFNRERKEFEDKTMQRFGELEQRLTASAKAPPATPAPPPPAPPVPSPTAYPPAAQLPAPPVRPAQSMPAGMPPDRSEITPAGLVHVSIAQSSSTRQPASTSTREDSGSRADTIGTYLPVSFTRGVLLGGLDAPTGGQSQSNPHPVLIRLSDNAVLPNRFRGEYRECFVIAAGYGDIGSERAYLRTENLSCVREDGSTLEVKIQGSVYGEDGKVGMRGRLVTKQGQMLANALLAGIASGIGQGLSTSATSYSTSALGTIASASGSDAYRTGLGSGVGRALDRLAQYYIKLAEQTFPVVEIDAGREVDVVITKGVRIDAPPPTASRPPSNAPLAQRAQEERHLKGSNDEDY